MRAQGSHMARNSSTTTVSDRLRRRHAAMAANSIAGMPIQKMTRLPVSWMDPEVRLAKPCW